MKKSTDFLCSRGRQKILKNKQIKCLSKTVRKLFCINFTKLYAKDLLLFRQYLRNAEFSEEMSTALNEYRENLLHLACQFNEPQHIKQLIALKCPVFKQDFYGRTPLHVAIQREHKECIDEFERILTSVINLPESDAVDKNELIGNLRKMFEVYNHDGYTILHLAVLKNCPTLVKVMLTFCLKFKINILEKEVLGSGDSILHLAVKNNFKDIENIIVDKVKDSVNQPNYSGATPYKIITTDEDLTDDRTTDEDLTDDLTTD
ncbi:nuclear factor NF-kappa-B p110 subunit-like [Lucilia sericata]|uniref:nuclear factor NF-kappa-B p110 subunit-like n=1 Tax=Lucilia sericata TaxID=13632 RepID=UPI0018A867FB|nr:nuclear factor NF-kappa-B p110 subunit-like [Lucilia sericata]